MFLSFTAIGTSFCPRLGIRTCTDKTKKVAKIATFNVTMFLSPDTFTSFISRIASSFLSPTFRSQKYFHQILETELSNRLVNEAYSSRIKCLVFDKFKIDLLPETLK